MNNQKLLKYKKGWIARDFVIASLLFTGIVSFMILFMGGIAVEYNNDELVSDTFTENYDKLSELSEDIDTMRTASTAGEGLSFIGTFDVTFQATFTVVQLVFGSLETLAVMPGQMIVDFTFIDSIVIANFFVIILAIITTILVFVWISSISRSKL